MGTARAEIDIAKPADEVWALIKDFGGLAGWMPGIDTCELSADGTERVVGMMGMEITERLVRCDDDARVIAYGIVAGPVAVEHHEATITVNPAGGSSHVTYDVDVDDSMVDMMHGMYAKSLEVLKTRLED